MRIRNLYDPPTLKDYPANAPWTPEGTTSTGEKTTDGWKLTVTGSAVGWDVSAAGPGRLQVRLLAETGRHLLEELQ